MMFTYGFAPFEPQAAAEQQTPVNDRWYTQVNAVVSPLTTPAHVGGFTKVVFDAACSITDVGVVLATTYGGATTRQYRLAVYRDNGTGQAPGALVEDLGLLSIATGATNGTKSLACASPIAVAAGETMWLGSIALIIGSGLPALYCHAAHVRPYADKGVGGGSAAAVALAAPPAGSFAASFAYQTEPVVPSTVAVYAQVSV